MADNEFWDQLTKPETLKQGWNLARNDARNNFFDAPFYSDVFTVAFDQNIAELAKRLTTESYHPSPITFVDVPKSSLAIRPGSLPEIEDRVVLQSIVKLLAPRADEELPEAVYSYRVKSKPSPKALFKESDVLDLPYLKSKTISKYFDPFDPWYAAWPEFDEKSKATFLKDGFDYLVATDIAAYFENIQLPLLRDGLLKIFPHEQKIINLLLSFLEHWCPRTDQHRTFHRGIPQGTQISSFLGNLFLLPLDRALVDFCNNHNARYFRYMDDVRLFTKDYSTARKALLLIDKTIRSLHLNTQSAKTEILAEQPDGEITKKLIDVRIDKINFVIDTIKEKKRKLRESESIILEDKLYQIAKEKPKSEFETKMLLSQKPLKGLTFRAFRRWLTAQMMLKGSSYYVGILDRELRRNPDHRLTRGLVAVTRSRPRLTSIGNSLLTFIESDLNILPHQHAEILWAFRYLSRIPPRVIHHCRKVVLDEHEYFYVRSEAALLLSRIVLDKPFLDECRNAFNNSSDANVSVALAVLLMQSTGKFAGPTLHALVFHPSEKIRKVGKLLREVRYDPLEAKQRLKFLFGSDNDWILCDYMGLLFSMALSDRPEILKELIKRCMLAAPKTPRMDLRVTLEQIAVRANIQLANVSQVSQPPGLVAANAA